MNEYHTPTDQLIDLVQRAEIRRNEEIFEAAKAATLPDVIAEHATSLEVAIGQEAYHLQKRMRFLSAFPWMPRFLGGSAINMLPNSPYWNYPGKRMITEPLLATQAEHMGDASVSSFFEVAADVSTHTDIATLTLYNTASEEVTQRGTRSELFTISIRMDSKGESGATIQGESFDDYRYAQCKTAFDSFKEENPWVEKLMVFKDGGLWTAIPSGSEDSVSSVEKQKVNDLVDNLNEIEFQKEYPDDLYYFPLGILMQANRELREK